jgi:hypothetical protein
MYAHTRKKTGDTVNFYNNLETQTEKVNKCEYFTEAWQLHVMVVNGEVERTVGFRVVTILMSTVKVWKVLPIPQAPYQVCCSGSLIENIQNTIFQDTPTHVKEDC